MTTAHAEERTMTMQELKAAVRRDLARVHDSARRARAVRASVPNALELAANDDGDTESQPPAAPMAPPR